MAFWIAALAMAALVSATLARALTRAGGVRTDNPDLQVYRDQLAEVERDVARGTIAGDEAERLRAEVSRRLIAAHRDGGDAAQAGPGGRVVAAAVALILIGGSAAVYWRTGAPGYPDMPLRARVAAADEAARTRPGQADAEAQAAAMGAAAPQDASPEFLDLMGKLRAALRDRPDDLQGHVLLARNEANLGNFAAAAAATREVIRLKGAEAGAGDHADLAEMMILAAGGYVSPEAEAELRTALEMDPRNGAARYYLGLMQAQTGRPDLAFATWRDLLDQSRPDAPWVPAIRAQIGDVAELAGVRYTPPAAPGTAAGAPGPDAADMAAASQMTPEERQTMIRGMVDGLAERLSTEGGPPEDWARLIGALGVLGETARAQAIWAEAQQVFADAPDALEQIRGAAAGAGLTE